MFKDVFQMHEDEFIAIGICLDDFGTHSICKGTETFFSTGCTVLPPIASICFHTNWLIERLKDRYIKYKKACDQFVGRAVSGLPILKK